MGIIRRMNRLGLRAERALRRHFSQYGEVVRVLRAHSTGRTRASSTNHPHRRPSSLGFVHMASADTVLQILALGPEQDVEGSMLRVQKFVRQFNEIDQRDDHCGKEDVEDFDAADASTISFESPSSQIRNWRRCSEDSASSCSPTRTLRCNSNASDMTASTTASAPNSPVRISYHGTVF